ncbi:MAG: sigma-70 family RNA polymerase sigma factor [Actinomycetota bacterium]|nr:sigma-70 family RNA polymerase sigma factor [Actinomycetota bacterium]
MGSVQSRAGTDQQLLRGIGEGDIRAFDEFYGRHSRVAYGVAVRVLGDGRLAEDAVQEAFLNVWRTASRFDAGRGNPTTWLFTLVHRRAVDAVRRQQKHSHEQIDEQRDEGEQPDFLDLDFSPGAVRAQLALLPRRDRELLVWAHYEGLSQSEIALRAGLPLGTVKSRMFHAYGKLRAAFDSLVQSSERLAA